MTREESGRHADKQFRRERARESRRVTDGDLRVRW